MTPEDTALLNGLQERAGWYRGPYHVLSGNVTDDFREALALIDRLLAQQEAQAREKASRACECRHPDPVMQADDKFHCHICSFETGARPSMLPELEILAIIKAKVAAEARIAVLEQELKEQKDKELSRVDEGQPRRIERTGSTAATD